MEETKSFFNTALGKAVLEALRWGVCAVVSQLLVLLPAIDQTTNVITLIIVLRFIDAVLHKSGVATYGITRF